jgi:phthiocerol/phenolphthiocerol synthesis type-I polyketide synthase E
LGFLSYTAANLFMDVFASSRNQNGSFTWLSANWDHWPEETRQYAGIRTSIDQYTMTPAESEEAFRRVACMAPGGQIVISTGDLASRIGLWVTRKITPHGQNSGSDIQTSSHQRPRLQTSYAAPRDETEQAVADAWEQVLGIQQVGIHDNFFDLGGHSLLVTQVIGRLRDTFEIDLPLSKLFDYPTVAGLAEVIRNIQTEAEDRERLEILKILSRLTEEEVEAEIAKRTPPERP